MSAAAPSTPSTSTTPTPAGTRTLPAVTEGAGVWTTGPRGALLGLGVGAILLLVVAPMTLSGFGLDLLGRYLCMAMVAVGIGLVWGRGGMLAMGQGVYFGLGAYIMAMHMTLADTTLEGESIPTFMRQNGVDRLPELWGIVQHPVVAVAAVVLVPTGVAGLLGWAIFSRRVKGAYFAILSQALAAAFAVLIIGQPVLTNGSNGLSNFHSLFGWDLSDSTNRTILFLVVAAVLLTMLAVTWQLYRSRFGELLVAVRDQEERVRFLGYDPALVKTVAYMIAALFAAIGGALFVPVVGIISPADIGVVPSIAFLIGVAIGGRATWLGPVLGSIAVSFAGTQLASVFPSFWVYFQGLLFILVIGFLPGGLASVTGFLRRRKTSETIEMEVTR
ncbi:urea ABC transporter permease subunit UrtC [Kocuria sp. JC486]|uniref:Urea ABC transporter permease subunit UrtC n=1 Tax=Kocuria soli TaxID=2485125 RepID=A0A3N3ZNY1_9MICC|nr:urea ABC transporter permease subunit UrtC [Kocuria sp. JC486]NHU86092.1 urea ABC transporter permease subunit UrtC [Kocuria sp. JC486]ROZ61736.1 urea ABC transporter permease subunit UrtC [Kocuria soli]